LFPAHKMRTIKWDCTYSVQQQTSIAAVCLKAITHNRYWIEPHVTLYIVKYTVDRVF